MFLREPRIDFKDQCGIRALSLAVEKGNEELVRNLEVEGQINPGTLAKALYSLAGREGDVDESLQGLRRLAAR